MFFLVGVCFVLFTFSLLFLFLLSFVCIPYFPLLSVFINSLPSFFLIYIASFILTVVPDHLSLRTLFLLLFILFCFASPLLLFTYVISVLCDPLLLFIYTYASSLSHCLSVLFGVPFPLL